MSNNATDVDLRAEFARNADNVLSQEKGYEEELVKVLKEMEEISKTGRFIKVVIDIDQKKGIYLANKLGELGFHVRLETEVSNSGFVYALLTRTHMIISWFHPNVQTIEKRIKN